MPGSYREPRPELVRKKDGRAGWGKGRDVRKKPESEDATLEGKWPRFPELRVEERKLGSLDYE